MKGLVNGIKIICILMLPLMMYVMIVRLNNGRDSFLHMNDLLTNLQDLDFYSPIERFTYYFTITIPNAWERVNSLTHPQDIAQVFEYLGAWFTFMGTLLYTPIDIIVNIIRLITEYIDNLFHFMHFIINA